MNRENMIISSNRIVVWFKRDNQWTTDTEVRCGLKRIFQPSMSGPTRIMVRRFISQKDSMYRLLEMYKDVTEIKLCHVGVGSLYDPDSNSIVGELTNVKLKRWWLNFPKESGYTEVAIAPFYEFEGDYKAVDNLPFADIYFEDLKS